MTRILWITDNEFDSQTWMTRVVEIVSNLQKTYDVQLVTSYNRRKIQPESFNRDIVYFSMAKRPGLKAASRFIVQGRIFGKTAEEFRPDIVLINAWNPLLVRRAVSLRRKHDVRIILDTRTVPVSHNKLRNRFWTAILVACLRNTAKNLDGITYITETMREYCIEKYRLPPHANAVWSSGVNPQLFSPTPEHSVSDHFRILYHGCIARQRRIDNVIKALTLLKDIDVHFSLLGDGDSLNELKRLAETIGMKDRVSFHGPVANDQVPTWINRCDVGVLPFQDWHGWNVSSPIKLFEYLACGKPVVVTDIPAHRNVLKEAEFAFWAGQSSPEHIAAAIRQAHERRKDFGPMASNARKLVLGEYTWERQAEKLKCFCEHLLRSK
ncbi:MAG: glycosyltransferase family 4 protein [Planctomycetota bacterium]|jgi:glycosyltransferase involved in cell wall biosynthesis